MKIKLAKTRGFCYGVKKAVRTAEKKAAGAGPVFTLGQLIHNSSETGRLRKLGVHAARSPEEASGTVIIRTHGVPRRTVARLKKKGARVIDATCPFVKKIQSLVARLSGEGYLVIIAGKREHPEVKALVSYASGPIKVLNGAAGVKRIPADSRVAVISQSTQTAERFEMISNAVKKRFPDARVYRTICSTSVARQKEAEALAEESDVMLVIGGRNSANTRHLAELAGMHTKTYHIEAPGEIRSSWFNGVKTAGITAGASTPERLIAQAVKKIQIKRKGKDHG